MTPLNTELNMLNPVFRTKVYELLARLTEAKILVRIINTFRTTEQQAELRKKGVSWVARSKHQDGLAIDLCPIKFFAPGQAMKLNWDGTDPVWEEIGLIGEKLGLIWGGRWKQKDYGHLEMTY